MIAVMASGIETGCARSAQAPGQDSTDASDEAGSAAPRERDSGPAGADFPAGFDAGPPVDADAAPPVREASCDAPRPARGSLPIALRAELLPDDPRREYVVAFTAPAAARYSFEVRWDGRPLEDGLDVRDGEDCSGPRLHPFFFDLYGEPAFRGELRAGQTILLVVPVRGRVLSLAIDLERTGALCVLPEVLPSEQTLTHSSGFCAMDKPSVRWDYVFEYTAPVAGTYLLEASVWGAYGCPAAIAVLDAAACDAPFGGVRWSPQHDAGFGEPGRRLLQLTANESISFVVTPDGECDAGCGVDTTLRRLPVPTSCGAPGELEARSPHVSYAALGSDELAPSCGVAAEAEAVFTFQAPVDGVYLFDAGMRGTLAVLEGSGCAGAELRCAERRARLSMTAAQIVTVAFEQRGVEDLYALEVRRETGTCAEPAPLVERTVHEPYWQWDAQDVDGADFVSAFTAPDDGCYRISAYAPWREVADFTEYSCTALRVLDGATCDAPLLAASEAATSDCGSELELELTAGQPLLVLSSGDSYDDAPVTTAIEPCPR